MKTSDPTKKREGFHGQKAVVIPRSVLSQKCIKNDIISNLYITDMGYYPKARYHYRVRAQGADQHILIYCQEGAGKVTIRSTEYPVQSGDFVIIPSKAAHSYEADEKSPWTIYWVHFKGTISQSIVSLMEKKQGGLKGFVRSNESILSLFNEMYNQLSRGYGSDNLMFANMCLWHFLTSFIYNYQYHPSVTQRDPVDMAIDYLGKHLDKILTLEDMASEVNLSPSHFSFIFKKKTGFSPIEYFNHLKVQKACQYLLFTNLRIKEIALEVGIEDPYYFSRLFTKVMGTAPNEYREKKVH